MLEYYLILDQRRRAKNYQSISSRTSRICSENWPDTYFKNTSVAARSVALSECYFSGIEISSCSVSIYLIKI